MIIPAKRRFLKYMIAALAFLTLIIGCSPSTPQNASPPNSSNSSDSSKPTDSVSQTPPLSSESQTADKAKELLLNMKQLAEQGKVINSNFPVKTTVMEDVKSQWGEPEKTEWVAAAKGNYATYSNHGIVFGFNKGSQIFEVRSFDEQLQNISLTKTKEVFGTPAYDVNVNGEEIVGYTAGQEFKIEFVFPQPTASDPNPMIDHYLVFYPAGTVNSMADDPGRQW